jgi:alpha-L-fucosidase
MQVMAEVFSKGGNFLLNVGPQPSGKIPQGEIDRLKEIGDWMKINGEAVYGSKRSPFTTVPDWGFITRMGQKLYLWVFDWPASGETLALPFDNPVTKAWLLDGGSSVKVIKNKGNATTLRLPEFAPDSVVSIIAMEVTGNLP